MALLWFQCKSLVEPELQVEDDDIAERRRADG